MYWSHILRSASRQSWAPLLLLLFAASCGGGDDPDPIADSGVVNDDAGFVPGDDDQDEWKNEEDNCPNVTNPEQRDRDHDGIGDSCDSCPATPNNGQNGQVSQEGCEIVTEAEPNDEASAAMPIVLVPEDRLLEVRGAIEAPDAAGQAYDRFALMLPARTMIRVRVARTSLDSLLEPAFIVTGGSYESPRGADGLFIAERDIYVSTAGTYEIAVADRRGAFGVTPDGDDAFGYALSIRVVPFEIVTVAPPLDRQLFWLGPAGSVRVLESDVAAAPRLRLATQTTFGLGGDEGLDPILVLETENGATVVENDNLGDGYRDARIIAPINTAQRIRIVLDYGRLYGGTDLNVRLTFDQPADGIELEPNDLVSLATPLIFPGETVGDIDRPRPNGPDVDFWTFNGVAGQIAALHVLLGNASQLDPYISVGRLVGEDFVPMYVNLDSSGVGARTDIILPETGPYYVEIGDQRNTEEPYRGGNLLFTYRIFGEVIGLQPASTSTVSGPIRGTINPGGRIIRHVVTTQESALLEVRTESVGTQDFTPLYRIFGTAGIGEYGAGIDTALAYVPAAASYVIGVQNADGGQGGSEFSYEAEVSIIPHVAIAEVEPNDTEAQALVLNEDLTVISGRIGAEGDRDRVRIAARPNAILDAVILKGARGRTVSIYRLGANTPLANGIGGLADFAIPNAGPYTIEVTGPVGEYDLFVRLR